LLRINKWISEQPKKAYTNSTRQNAAYFVTEYTNFTNVLNTTKLLFNTTV